jgi:putative DNA primase/helicase
LKSDGVAMDDVSGKFPPELVSPIPPDAPKPPRSHPKWGRPTARWTYRDANGAMLQIVFRFDPPDERKQFLPCTLWRDAKGLRWLWKGLPSPRPLYGLERLATDPDAHVIICEGEKSADAAARIFPDRVAVTSPGGSQAAAKADWTPSAGRQVVILPDNDEPGMKYADEVAAILTEQGCEVSIIDADALASIDPGGRRIGVQRVGTPPTRSLNGRTSRRCGARPSASPSLIRQPKSRRRMRSRPPTRRPSSAASPS